MANNLGTALGNGNGDALELPKGAHRRSVGTLYVWGTFDGATVKIQASPNGVDWLDITGVSYTSETVENLEIVANSIRAVVTGGGGSVSVNVEWQ